jgi:uncharacterized short protein YbdD (DUF466 family)
MKALLFTSSIRARRLLWIAWRFLRRASGDDAYERYLQHMALKHPDREAMSRSQYFRSSQDQKWNKISRCC